jgi:FKBP-type peptidyl-prolyl cis-trans isomerase 2
MRTPSGGYGRMVGNMPVKDGDRIKVEYEGSLSDGTVFDSSEDGGPLEFIVGSGEVIGGFEKAVIGMEIGDESTVTLDPADAYRDADPDLIMTIPKDNFPEDLEAGIMVLIEDDSGTKVPALITEIGEETITLDLNHPLAGKTLTFTIKIIEIVGED